MTEAEQHLIDVAILLAPELPEYVDVALECAGSNSAELATQELLAEWEEAYKACGFHEEDHVRVERGISPMLCTTSEWVSLDDPRNMPAPGQRVLAYYRSPIGIVGPVVCTPADGGHFILIQYDGYCPIICWHAIPDEPMGLER